jgi:dephospho-CoA kinase
VIVAGLTGSIAMGKSETAKMFAARDIPVFDSDQAVHELYAKGGEAVGPLSAIAPAAIVDGAVDRQRLAGLLREDPPLLKKIEAVVHPLVKSRQMMFLEQARADGVPLVVLDIPLLFETGRDKDVDKILVVSAPPAIQRERALRRPGMTVEKLEFILARQTPDDEKRARADYVIDTSYDLETTARQVERIIAELKNTGQAE